MMYKSCIFIAFLLFLSFISCKSEVVKQGSSVRDSTVIAQDTLLMNNAIFYHEESTNTCWMKTTNDMLVGIDCSKVEKAGIRPIEFRFKAAK